MMTDSKLLKAAAKAANLRIEGDVDKLVVQPGHFAGGFSVINNRGGSSLWNPLTDDADALRLAVKLEIEIRVFNGKAHAGKQNKFWCTEHVITVGDQCAATRRAIVRAAAAMATE